MKKTILFLAAFLLSAGSLAAQTSAEGVRNVIYLIGDGMGLAQVSMLKIENGYEPTAFDRAGRRTTACWGSIPKGMRCIR